MLSSAVEPEQSAERADKPTTTAGSAAADQPALAVDLAVRPHRQPKDASASASAVSGTTYRRETPLTAARAGNSRTQKTLRLHPTRSKPIRDQYLALAQITTAAASHIVSPD